MPRAAEVFGFTNLETASPRRAELKTSRSCRALDLGLGP